MELYGIGDKHPQYRLKLKNRFGDKVTFLSPNYHSAQIVISENDFKNRVYLPFLMMLSQKYYWKKLQIV